MDALEDPQPTHADLRSPSHASTRFAKQSQKYYAFRSGPMSRIGQSILYIPMSQLDESSFLTNSFFHFADAPLVTHPRAVRVRTWTKRDQFEERMADIWPLDRKNHKFGRRRRGRGCNYVPPRWEMERSTKGRGRLVKGDELDMEEEGAADAAVALNEESFVDEYDAETEFVDFALCHPEEAECMSDGDYDMLSDLSSVGDESEWEVLVSS